MQDRRQNCLEHSGLHDRVGLLLKLNIAAVGGIVALVVLCANIYIKTTETLAYLDKQVALNTTAIQNIERELYRDWQKDRD